MAQQPVSQRSRLGFGESSIVRDEPSVLVAEEGRFPASVWWGCVLACLFAWFLAGSLGMINLSSVFADVRNEKPNVLLILITMSGVLVLVPDKASHQQNPAARNRFRVLRPANGHFDNRRRHTRDRYAVRDGVFEERYDTDRVAMPLLPRDSSGH